MLINNPKHLIAQISTGRLSHNESEIANALNSFYANAPSKYTSVRSTDLHDDVAENINNLVNKKVNTNTLFALQEI